MPTNHVLELSHHQHQELDLLTTQYSHSLQNSTNSHSNNSKWPPFLFHLSNYQDHIHTKYPHPSHYQDQMQIQTPTTLYQTILSPTSALMTLPSIPQHTVSLPLTNKATPSLALLLVTPHILPFTHSNSYSPFPFNLVSLNANTSNFCFKNIHPIISILSLSILHSHTLRHNFHGL